MICCFAKRTWTTRQHREAGWWPDFWHTGVNYEGPVCRAYRKAHLTFDANGDADLRASSASPKLAIPLFKHPNMG